MADDDTPAPPPVVSRTDVRITDVLVRQFAHGLAYYSVVQLDKNSGRVKVRSTDGREFWQAACMFDRRLTREEAGKLNIQWRVSPAQRPRQVKGKTK